MHSNKLTLTKEEIQLKFRQDLQNIMWNMDIFGYAERVERDKQDSTFQVGMTIDLMESAKEQMAINVNKVISTYLTYDPERFPDPLDQYIWIVSKRDEIEDILITDMGTSIGTDPIKWCIRCQMLCAFKQVWDLLVGVGGVHKFDPEIIQDCLYKDALPEEG